MNQQFTTLVTIFSICGIVFADDSEQNPDTQANQQALQILQEIPNAEVWQVDHNKLLEQVKEFAKSKPLKSEYTLKEKRKLQRRHVSVNKPVMPSRTLKLDSKPTIIGSDSNQRKIPVTHEEFKRLQEQVRNQQTTLDWMIRRLKLCPPKN